MEPNDIPVTPEEDEAWAEHGRRRGYFPFPIKVDPTLPSHTLKIVTPTDEIVVELDEEEYRQ